MHFTLAQTDSAQFRGSDSEMYCTLEQTDSAQFRGSDSEMYCTLAQTDSAQFRVSDSEMHYTLAQTDSAQFRVFIVPHGFHKLATRISCAEFNGTKDGQFRRFHCTLKESTQTNMPYSNRNTQLFETGLRTH
jgi:hypothetical protein